MEKFLASSHYIDWQHPAVLQKARQLAGDMSDQHEITQRCFQFVRDHIRHSWDYQQNPVTCIASDVLEYGTGYCYAKSHLLAALLRANGIPAGLCYQRLMIGNEPPFCLHGLNAVFLPEHGWYRIDARGNKPGVQAEFCPPQEQLAFAIKAAGEQDFTGIWDEPHALILAALQLHKTVQAVAENLPDADLSAELTPASIN